MEIHASVSALVTALGTSFCSVMPHQICVIAWQDIITNITTVLSVSNIDVPQATPIPPIPPPTHPPPLLSKKEKKSLLSVIAKTGVLNSSLLDHEM